MSKIHPSALVETDAIGAGTTIWAFVHILPGVRIGSNCNICDHCFIEDGVDIGDKVNMKSGIYLWRGVTVEDNVFLGPNVVFTNDLRPRSKQHDVELAKTVIGYGASVGANSTILAGVRIGRFAMTGIGAVITRSVPDYALVYGNPARQHGWVDEYGQKLLPQGPDRWRSADGLRTYLKTATGLQPTTSPDLLG
jgi:acetyltransferase-like isoleucine patch superfamily enzyme